MSRRDHSELELQQKLLQRQFPPQEISLALEYCRENGWLDDARFAGSLLRQGVSKHHGWMRICQEAKRKGIEIDVLECAERDADIDWYALAKDAAQKKYANFDGIIPPPSDVKEKAKRMRYLQYRGFNFDQINYALSSDSED